MGRAFRGIAFGRAARAKNFSEAMMDHNEALRLHAVEKYALGELPPSLRNEFEEHYFECEECAEDVRAAAEFVDNVRAVLRFAA